MRGPQSALFGRNTLGGLVSVTSARPSLTGWTGRLAAPFGSAGARDVRASVSGPVAGSVALGLSFGHSERDGFTINDVTGHALDSRSANFGKAQVLWVPAPTWETRLIVSGERALDGDYALNDLGELRRNPFHVLRDFEGRTDRDIRSTTVLLRREGRRFALSSTTGYVSWTARDLTDLDYTPLPLMTRDNAEKDRQFTQEIRVASAAQAPAHLSNQVFLTWQIGVFLFTQHYAQNAINTFAPLVLSPYLAFPVSQHSPQSALVDAGLGVHGLGTLTFGEALDLTVGARVDHERKVADLRTFYDPAIAPPTHVHAERTFSDVSPQAAIAWRLGSDRMAYASVGRGFKAGGFNPASPIGSESYREERAWNAEGGVKTLWARGRLSANAAFFRINWDDMQLNVPNPAVPAQFYIANVGGARSTGVVVEVNARLRAGVDLYGAPQGDPGAFRRGKPFERHGRVGSGVAEHPGYTASMGLQALAEAWPRGSVLRIGRMWCSTGRITTDDMNRPGRTPTRSRTCAQVCRRATVHRRLGEERIRRQVCPDRLCLRKPRALRLRWRERASRTFGVTARLVF